MVKRGGKFAFLVQVVAFLLLILPSVSFCGDIMVQPGKFDHFDIKIHQKIAAGDKVPVEITAVDSFNNIIPNFNDSRREFTVSVSGSTSLTPSTLSSSAFVKGVAIISLRDTVAESFTMTIFENGNTIPLQARDIQVFPGKLASLIVRGPRAVPAGDKFDVKMLAVDSFGNTVSEQIYGRNINVLFKGGAEPKIIGESVTDFKNGVGTITLMSEKAGAFTIEVRDLVTGGIGTSEWIEVVNNTLASFKLMSPKEIIAGEPFEISIAAIDTYSNVVKNYASTGSGVSVASSGNARPFPSTISAFEFINGHAKVTLRYDTTENTHDITLTATEVNRKSHGVSDPIRVVRQIPSKYEVTNPESAIAGQKFRIKVTVYNQIGNPIKNYNLMGPDVMLSTTGSGKLTPTRIPASEFVNGSTLVDVQYNKSEAFSILAEPVTPVKSTDTSAIKLTEKVETTPRREPPAEQRKIETASARAAKPAEKVEPAPRRETPVEQRKIETTSKTEIMRTPTIAKTEIMRAPTPAVSHETLPLDITGISIVESKKNTVVSIHIPGLAAATKLKYSSRAITMDGKKWIAIAISPATSKVLEPVRFDSSSVGKVVIESGSETASSVLLKIENLQAAKFKIDRSDKSLAVTLAR